MNGQPMPMMAHYQMQTGMPPQMMGGYQVPTPPVQMVTNYSVQNVSPVQMVAAYPSQCSNYPNQGPNPGAGGFAYPQLQTQSPPAANPTQNSYSVAQGQVAGAKRSGPRRWTDDEEQKVIKGREAGKLPAQISKEIGRSALAINMRSVKILKQKEDAGENIGPMLARWSMTRQDLETYDKDGKELSTETQQEEPTPVAGSPVQHAVPAPVADQIKSTVEGIPTPPSDPATPAEIAKKAFELVDKLMPILERLDQTLIRLEARLGQADRR